MSLNTESLVEQWHHVAPLGHTLAVPALPCKIPVQPQEPSGLVVKKPSEWTGLDLPEAQPHRSRGIFWRIKLMIAAWQMFVRMHAHRAWVTLNFLRFSTASNMVCVYFGVFGSDLETYVARCYEAVQPGELSALSQ